jgi:putative oxidoreductase
MRATFARLEEPAYVLLRFFGGMMFACHGAQKVLGLFGGQVQPTFSFLWIGGVLELFGGLFVAVGLLTRPVAFIISGEMMVAYFRSHFAFEFGNFHWLPIMNKGELAVIYCFVFLYICGRGPGRASLDRMIGIES